MYGQAALWRFKAAAAREDGDATFARLLDWIADRADRRRDREDDDDQDVLADALTSVSTALTGASAIVDPAGPIRRATEHFAQVAGVLDALAGPMQLVRQAAALLAAAVRELLGSPLRWLRVQADQLLRNAVQADRRRRCGAPRRSTPGPDTPTFIRLTLRSPHGPDRCGVPAAA